MSVRFGFSIVAAACSEATTYPLDMTKTRLQIQGEKAAKDKTPQSGFVKMMFNIVKKEGITKLYFGVSPAIYRHLIYTTFRMTAYQHLRPKITNDSLAYKAALGLFCGGAGQLLANPFDLVKVQMQAEGKRIMQGHPPRVTSHTFTWCSRRRTFDPNPSSGRTFKRRSSRVVGGHCGPDAGQMCSARRWLIWAT